MTLAHNLLQLTDTNGRHNMLTKTVKFAGRVVWSAVIVGTAMAFTTAAMYAVIYIIARAVDL